ncbi:MAG: CBS domain-containing protein [Gemmatimonadaceae bacterium]
MMKANDLMTRRPACASTDDTVQHAAQLMIENDCGCLPVVDAKGEDRVVGVITDRDIAVRGIARGKGADTLVRDLMTSELSSCLADSDVKEVTRLMSDRQIRRVVVIDDDGSCVGIVAQADLARAADGGTQVTDREVAQVVERVSEPTRR